MVMESIIWSSMVRMIFCGLVWMLMYFLVKSQMVLFGYVWSCKALCSYAQFLCLFIEGLRSEIKVTKYTNRIKYNNSYVETLHYKMKQAEAEVVQAQV